jgi:hypothetical protein
MERRSQTRLLDSEYVTLSWEEHSAKLTQLGSIYNRSLGGLGLRIDHAMPVGAPVIICYNGEEITGIVRHYTAGIQDHFVGIELAPGDQPLIRHVLPEIVASLN